MQLYHPIHFFTKQLRTAEQFSDQNLSSDTLKKIVAWYAKILITEPFRLFEKYKFEHSNQPVNLPHPPIFILGHWRSGTSILQMLLSQDPQRGYLNKFASVFPNTFFYFERVIKPIVRRITDSLQTKEEIDDISVSWDWDTPGELDIAMTTAFLPTSPHWAHVFPQTRFYEYIDKYMLFDTATQQEQQEWKHLFSYFMRKVSAHNNHQQLIIKSPGNTSRIPQLLDLYPDARFVYIHRNPYDVFYSNKKMWKVILDNLAFETIDEQTVEEYIFYLYKNLLDRYLKHRSQIPSSRLVEIRFEELTANPLHKLEYIYDQLQLSGFTSARPHFERFITENVKTTGNHYRYQGDIVSRIEREWGIFLKEWSYPSPRQPVLAE
jgi:hypothetical protein